MKTQRIKHTLLIALALLLAGALFSAEVFAASPVLAGAAPSFTGEASLLAESSEEDSAEAPPSSFTPLR